MIKDTNKKAFSVAEMMIVLLVLSIILAASMPIITKRSKSSVDKTWQAATNGSDAFFGTGATQGIVIGATSFPIGSYGKLLLNTENSTNTDIAHTLYSSTDKGILAKLRFAEHQFEFGKNAISSAANSTAIGHNTNATANSTAIGENAIANATNSTALGFDANATAQNSTAIGVDSIANAANSTAIGYGSNATETGATAVGNGAIANATNSLSFGFNTNANASNSMAIGTNSIANATNTTALGVDSQATGTNSVAIGYNAQASGIGSIAIGNGANVTTDNSIIIGNAFSSGTDTLNMGLASNITTINLGFNDSDATVAQTINIGSNGTYKSTVNIKGTVNITGALNINGAPYVSSDIRKKNIIGEYKSGLDDIIKIKTYEYTYKDDLNKKNRVGVIAQDLQKIFPKAIKKDEKGYLSIRHEDMFFAIINAIKELNSKITTLQKENSQLKKQVEELSKRIEILEKINK